MYTVILASIFTQIYMYNNSKYIYIYIYEHIPNYLHKAISNVDLEIKENIRKRKQRNEREIQGSVKQKLRQAKGIDIC